MSEPRPFCARHPEVPAEFRCESCARTLCAACVQESHALFLCRACGERALPIAGGGSVRERRREAAVAGPYPLSRAFGYAFRGMGKFLFGATLLSMAFVEFVVRFGWGCLPIVLAVGFWALVIGLQFKIVRTTARGDDELPDWPEFHAWGERFREIATYLWVSLLQVAPPALYLLAFGGAGLVAGEPSLPFWIGFALVAWSGAGLSLFGFAAAALSGGEAALRVDRHLRGFVAAGGDAVAMTNLLFAVGVVAFVVRAALAGVPIVGPAVAGVVGAYWVFTSAHLVGVLVRRRGELFRELYP